MNDPACHSRNPLALVIDDDDTMRLLLRRTLENEGFSVVQADNGITGVELCLTTRPDLVLLDVIMPELDGFDACRLIRNALAFTEVPVVMMTGLDDVDSINHAYAVGATDFITKPINWGTFGYRLRYLLRASQAFADLAASQAGLVKAQRLARLGSWEWDAARREFRCSEELFQILNRKSCDNRLSFDDFSKMVHRDERNSVAMAMAFALKRQQPLNRNFRIVLEDGTERILHGQSDGESGASAGQAPVNGTFQDITERCRAEEQIRRLVNYDDLTGLPNRTLFKEILEKAIGRAKRENTLVAVLFLDLDKFQRVNDILGPNAGDALLKLVAERLLRVVREGDTIARSISPEFQSLSLARLGGDEFTLLLDNIPTVDVVGRVAGRVLETLTAAYHLDGSPLYSSASIGIAVFPSDGDDVDSLMRNGDSAMNYAKELGRSNYQFYCESFNSMVLQKLSLENSLRTAIEKKQLFLHYQPQLDIRTRRVIGMEALIRWHHPEKGVISPAQFIPIAEESGLILGIGEWVFREVCQQNKSWQRAGIGFFKVAVNLSGKQFSQKDFVPQLTAIIEETGIDPRYVELELTESILVEDVEKHLSTMKELKKIGFKLAIDDFGTGYSSLNYLKRFPLDILKIDKSFVVDVTTNADDAAITGAIIAMASTLQLDVIAEGVEGQDQVSWLQQHGCSLMQGYHFSRPLPADQIPNFMLMQPRELDLVQD